MQEVGLGTETSQADLWKLSSTLQMLFTMWFVSRRDLRYLHHEYTVPMINEMAMWTN